MRQRLDVGKGEKKPRFRVVAVAGEGLHLYAGHLRKTELEQIAKDVGADIVYLAPMPEDSKRKEEDLGSPSLWDQLGRGDRTRRLGHTARAAICVTRLGANKATGLYLRSAQ